MHIVTINQVDPAHLEAVKADMQRLGAPVLRAIRDDVQGVIVALEGSHRIVAALELGIKPILTMVDADDMLSCDDIGYDDCGWFDGEPARAEDIRERIGSPNCTYHGCTFLQVDDEQVEVANA